LDEEGQLKAFHEANANTTVAVFVRDQAYLAVIQKQEDTQHISNSEDIWDQKISKISVEYTQHTQHSIYLFMP